jgi:hypothetical protein
MEPLLDARIRLLTQYNVAKDVLEWLKDNEQLPATADVTMLALEFTCGPGGALVNEDRAWLVRTLKTLN